MPTWEVAYLFPAQGCWTVAAYEDLKAARVASYPLIELCLGRLEVLALPSQLHQFIQQYLAMQLLAFATTRAPGVVLTAGMKVMLSRRQFRYPDVLYMREANAHRRTEKHWVGADLVMEIVSADPKDRHRDLVTKPIAYARGQIGEYWIVDPIARQIKVLTLDGSSYRVHGAFLPGTTATSVLLPGFTVVVDTALAPPGSSTVLPT
jgi:Uma2 family endonuclease